MTEVNTLVPNKLCKRRNLYTELSKTLTDAPNPRAVRVANSPTVPAPNTIISEGATPEIPPNMAPCPLLKLLKYSAAINMDALPAISLIERITEKIPSSSFNKS